MMSFLTGLKRILSSVMLFYCLIGVVIFFYVDGHKVKVNRLDSLKGWASYPVKYLDRREAYQENQFRYARKYYQVLTELILDYDREGKGFDSVSLSRAYAMIGFCDYYLGEYAKAVESYQTALKLQPKHFWFKYDLGIIYFRLGQYDKALLCFQECLSLTEADLNFLMNQDLYELWAPRTAQGYQKISLVRFYDLILNSYKLSILSYERMRNSLKTKELALVALYSNMPKKDNFFDYYAGFSTHPAKLNPDLFDLKVHPALYFSVVGQEKNLILRK